VKKVVIDKAGSYDRLRLRQFPDPVASGTEVLVKNSAVGVNFADCIVRMGLYSSATEYVGWPITPGFEFAGVVEARAVPAFAA
jgi:NADPH:quinone reductase-like Zn-dependent oxidoreductase